MGKDAGHLYIQGILGSLKDTIEIDDLFYYNSQSITSTTILSIPDFPTNFKANFKIKRARSGSSGAWLEIGSDVNNCILLGCLSSDGDIGIFIKKNSTYITLKSSAKELINRNVETLIEYSLNNGVHTITANNTSVTVTDTNITARNYIRAFILNNMIKELKIHEL